MDYKDGYTKFSANNNRNYNTTQNLQYKGCSDTPTGAARVFSIISFVCGIISMLSCFYGFIFSVPAIVFSILSKVKHTGQNKKATLGMAFGIVGIVTSVMSFVVLIVICISIFDTSNQSKLF